MTTVIDFIMAGMVAEALGLLALRRRTGRAMLANLAAGGCLLLAMRLALGGAWWVWVSAALFGALLAHGLDLRSRWVS